MCGRISTAELSAAALKRHFELEGSEPFMHSYNVAPSLLIPAVRQRNHRRSLDSLSWGLIPHWAKDREIGLHTFNARIETLTQKPSFREAIRNQRCIIVASGFYEWRREGDRKKPYYIHRADGQPVALAGLWDAWLDAETGELIESCSMVSMAATRLMAEIHQRMPAILEPEYYAVWLDPEFTEPHVLQDLLKAEEHQLEIYAVSGYVNNSHNDGQRCIERVGD